MFSEIWSLGEQRLSCGSALKYHFFLYTLRNPLHSKSKAIVIQKVNYPDKTKPFLVCFFRKNETKHGEREFIRKWPITEFVLCWLEQLYCQINTTHIWVN